MSLIPGTNILVDKFSQGNNDVNSYVYFLSHFHTDHYSELHDSWDLGIIYAYNPTRTLLVDLYPNLETRCVGLECNQKYQIFLDKEQTETAQVTLFDSNHCPGSVMMLFEGRMGRVIHTGDFRFTEEFFTFKQLFPPELDNEEKFKCSIEIDHLIMDATFADPIKDHPQKQEAYDGICKIIRRHKKFRVYLFVYLLGKEEVFASLAKEFKTKVIVDEERYRKIQLLDLEPELYSTNPDDGWIHIKTKEERKGMDIEKYNEECPTIFITMSGRSNEDSSSKRFIYKSYYSSHSNARELEQFMKAIFPKKITYHSHPDVETQSKRLKNESIGSNYTFRDKEGRLMSTNEKGSSTDRDPHDEYESETFDREDERDSSSQSQTNEEQPSMITESELKSIDLNVLGECYVPSSDLFSDSKENDINEENDGEVSQQSQSENHPKTNTRNYEIINKRNKDGEKINSMDSQKINSMLQKSIDNFIYETEDILRSKPPSKAGYNTNSGKGHQDQAEFEKNIRNYNSQQPNMPRSLSQKYNYKKAPIGDPDVKYVHASPMNSGSKRFVYKKRPQMHPTPPRSQNTVSRRPENYQYSSLLNPHPSNGDVYYVQHQDGVKQNHHYSFNGPRRSEQHQDKYILQQPGGIFHNGNNPSYDENALPSNLNRNMPFSHQNLQGNNFSPEFQNPNDEPEYEPNVQNSRIGTSMTPINHSIKATVSTGQIHKNRPVAANYHENKSIELDYYRNSSSQKTPFNNTHNKRRSNQTIQEEQESRESPEESKIQTSHHKNYPERSGDQMEEGFVADETVYTSNPGVSRAQGPDDFQSARKTQVQQKHFDSFSNKLGDFSKEESPEPKNANLHFVLMNLQEILARNKIPVNQNPSDSSPDTIIKIVETISHELRLKRDRVEILENEDIEKTKTLDLLKDKNDDLMKAHQKLQRRYDEQDQELEQILRGRENELEEFREKEDAEKQELQYEIENLQSRNKLLERNYNEMENELAITNKNLNNFRAENDNLRYKLRQKEDSIFQNKLIKDKANSSFEVETNHQNILFYQRKEEEKTNNRNPIYTEESEDFSREGGSGDKKFKMQKGEIFDQYNPSKEIREIHKFFKDMNELFCPYKDCDHDELMEIIKEKYGILLQSEDLIGLKTQLEIILGLPKNCAKHLILNKIKNMVTSNNGAGSSPEIGMSIEDTEKLNNSELLVEINMLFDSIKSSLKLPKTTNYTQCLKAMKKIVSKRTFKANDRHEKRKTKNKYHASKVALNSTKIDLSKNLSFKKKASPSREISPAAMYSGPSSARNNSKYSKIVYPSVPFGEVPTTRLQPTQKIKRPKRAKKGSTSTSVQKRSPIIKKTKAVK